MTFLIFFSSVIVAVILERQARLHRQELVAEYERLGIPIPRPRPKLKRTEAWLNVGLGFVLIMLSLAFVQAGFWASSTRERALERMPEQMRGRAAPPGSEIPVILADGAFLLAGGVVLVWLGWKAIREITRYDSGSAELSAPVSGESGLRTGTHGAQRRTHLALTGAIAAGAFCAGILTGYFLLSGESHNAGQTPAGQATVSLEVESTNAADTQPGFAAELEKEFRSQLGSIPGVRVVEPPGAAYLFSAKLDKDDGLIVISWNVIRTRDHATYYERRFSIPADATAPPLRAMMAALSSTFGEKRMTAEFERILQLPEHSLD